MASGGQMSLGSISEQRSAPDKMEWMWGGSLCDALVGRAMGRRYLRWPRHGGRTLPSSTRSFLMPCRAGRAESGSA